MTRRCYAVFFGQRSGLQEDDLAEISRKERRYIRQFVLAVEAAIEAGVISPGDPRMIAHGILGMTSWSYKWFDPRRDTPEQFAECCVGLILGRSEPLAAAAP